MRRDFGPLSLGRVNVEEVSPDCQQVWMKRIGVQCVSAHSDCVNGKYLPAAL